MTTIIDPVRLAGLKQAAYVMGCLVRNDSEAHVIMALGGDTQLYHMWKSFLRHNQWIAETTHGYSITAKGSMWNKRVEST
jgi:hypothetical protein